MNLYFVHLFLTTTLEIVTFPHSFACHAVFSHDCGVWMVLVYVRGVWDWCSAKWIPNYILIPRAEADPHSQAVYEGVIPPVGQTLGQIEDYRLIYTAVQLLFFHWVAPLNTAHLFSQLLVSHPSPFFSFLSSSGFISTSLFISSHLILTSIFTFFLFFILSHLHISFSFHFSSSFFLWCWCFTFHLS